MALVPPEAAERLRRRYVPEEDAAIAPYGCEARIVRRDADVEDLIAVRRIGLDQLRWFRWCEGVRWVCWCWSARGVVQSNGAVCRAGQNVR